MQQLASLAGSADAIRSAVIEAIVMGMIATLATDVWQRLLQATAGLPPANWGLIGRWVAWFPRGVFIHRPISATPTVPGELAIGWAFHYVVGIVYAGLYLAIMALGFGSEPSLVSALIFAIVLLVAPWFVMQPALGLGFMASHAPNPVVTRAINVSTHGAFGTGLWLAFVLWRASAI
jgi:DUF2938 family protein